MLTTEPVLTEAAHLLYRHKLDPAILLQWIRRGAIHVGLQLELEAGRIEELMGAYADQPMSLADASLVRLSELHPQARIFTTDSDFAVYRRFGDQPIPLLIPG
jgi:predicted nucleic acid-binding protein